MSIILFIIVLAVLILVHEVGHFLAARSVGARVDEFGIGFPPRLWSFKPKGSETTYSINAIPFGGYVKIFGEDAHDASLAPEDTSRSLAHKSKLKQIWVLAAGVVFNILFAWILLWVGFMTGVPTSVTPETKGLTESAHVTLISVLRGAPAEEAGLMSGDEIISLATDEGPLPFTTVENVQEIIASHEGKLLTMTFEREGKAEIISITPKEGIVEGKGAIGVTLDLVGVVRLSPFAALIESARTTVLFLKNITIGIGNLIGGAFTGSADIKEISGPVGIVGMVGDAAHRGLIALLTFTALISLNLAIINLVPFPALDGGRILFVIIEAIKRSPINQKVSGTLNLIGFGLLILLMVAITVNDVVQLFAS
ncbi:MAG: RIP metalloprotease RseP [Patescibacteria group bacterium]